MMAIIYVISCLNYKEDRLLQLIRVQKTIALLTISRLNWGLPKPPSGQPLLVWARGSPKNGSKRYG